MKTRTQFTKATAASVILLFCLSAFGQLTATVQPGYEFAPGEAPTTATLNALGQPTITVSGTINGTVGLAAKTVSGVHLMDSVVDGATTDFNGSSPRAIIVKDLGITTAKLAAGAVTAVKMGAGVLQIVSAETASFSDNTAIIPLDNTIPQKTEGTQVLTATITPVSASSRLVVEVALSIGSNVTADNSCLAALFRDAGADAICAEVTGGTTSKLTLVLRKVVNSTSTAATTFTVRVGPSTGGNHTYINSNAFFNGTMNSTITVTEIL